MKSKLAVMKWLKWCKFYWLTEIKICCHYCSNFIATTFDFTKASPSIKDCILFYNLAVWVDFTFKVLTFTTSDHNYYRNNDDHTGSMMIILDQWWSYGINDDHTGSMMIILDQWWSYWISNDHTGSVMIIQMLQKTTYSLRWAKRKDYQHY